MKIEHAALYVQDLEATKEFFVQFFAAKPGAMYHNVKIGFKSYFLSFDDGARLEIMTRPELKAPTKDLCATWAHLAFAVGSKEKVDSLTQQLTAAGYSLLSGPRTTGDGYYESCIAGPDGCQLEITV